MKIKFTNFKLNLCFTFLTLVLFSIISYTTVFAATIGEPLPTPESGWKRYDDSTSQVKLLSSGWTRETGISTWYQGTTLFKKPTTNTDQITFKFYGTKLRIIGYSDPISYASAQTIIIDGNPQTYNQNCATINQPQTLVFEVLGLPLGVHTVVLKAPVSDLYTGLDAIDIDSTGYLITPTTSITLNKSNTNIFVGESETLIPTITPLSAANQSLTWTSSDTTIATVDTAGNVTGITAGTVTITATTIDGLTATCIVNVLPKQNTRAKLTITMTNGVDKQYDLSMTEVDAFINWYDNRANGSGSSYYTFTKTINVAPFIRIKQYVIFDKIVSFDVSEYNEI